MEAPAFPPLQLDRLLAEVELRPEGLDLLHQAIDQLLCTADGQRRNVVNRLVRVQLGALSAGGPQGIEDVGFHAEQAQLEYLKQAGWSRANDYHFGAYAGVAQGVFPLKFGFRGADSSDVGTAVANETGF